MLGFIKICGLAILCVLLFTTLLVTIWVSLFVIASLINGTKN